MKRSTVTLIGFASVSMSMISTLVLIGTIYFMYTGSSFVFDPLKAAIINPASERMKAIVTQRTENAVNQMLLPSSTPPTSGGAVNFNNS